MRQNVTRAQGLQEELAQRRASLLQDLAEAQALTGQEALLAEIVEEEMAHWTQVLVLSHHIFDWLKLSPKRLKDCLLCWRESKLSWNRSQNNNRVVSLRCLGFSQLHPG